MTHLGKERSLPLKRGKQLKQRRDENKDGIKAEIPRFYQTLYTGKEQWKPKARFESLNSLSQAGKIQLDRNFGETKAATYSRAPDKSAGPDSYTVVFYARAWDFDQTRYYGSSQPFSSALPRG